MTPVLTVLELYGRPHRFADQARMDLRLAERALDKLHVLAAYEAQASTQTGQAWPYWAEVALLHRAEQRERERTRRELRDMAVPS